MFNLLFVALSVAILYSLHWGVIPIIFGTMVSLFIVRLVFFLVVALIVTSVN